jgi:hypothetical protein
MHSWDDYAETYNYKVNRLDENGEPTGSRLTVPEGSMEKTAQVEDEWQEVMDEAVDDAHIYDGTKTPCEPGDSVKFQGHEGAIRGTIVEVNKAAGNAIVKAKGYEYRVALEDIQPLNSTFKKMYANSCIRILPPGKKYAQIFNNMEKNPSIDNPWAATWEARDKDLHSGPKETKNKDVKPIVKGYGKKSVTRPFDKKAQAKHYPTTPGEWDEHLDNHMEDTRTKARVQRYIIQGLDEDEVVEKMNLGNLSGEDEEYWKEKVRRIYRELVDGYNPELQNTEEQPYEPGFMR